MQPPLLQLIHTRLIWPTAIGNEREGRTEGTSKLQGMIQLNLLAYLALGGGMLMEGEAVLISASISARYGYMNIFAVTIFAIGFTLLSDWFWFFAGRKKGRQLLAQRPKLNGQANKVFRWIDSRPFLVASGYRFLYGFRSVIPAICGMSGMRPTDFLIPSFVSTLLWAVSISYLGFTFGPAIQCLLSLLKQYTIVALVILLFILILIIMFRKLSRGKSVVLMGYPAFLNVLMSWRPRFKKT